VLARLTAADVEAVRFRTTKFRAGYDQDGVDEFLEKVAAAFPHDRARPPSLRWRDVAVRQFAVTKFREGYDRNDVDAIIEGVVAELQRRERDRRSSSDCRIDATARCPSSVVRWAA
jgi:DivIVA domain-containing protein